MSSVQGARKCPKCGGVIVYDMNCRTTEVYEMCLRCGYEQQCVLIRNDDGTVKTDKNGDWLVDSQESIGYGTARLRYKSGIGRIYRFDKPLSEEERAGFMKEAQRPDMDDSSYVVLFDPQSGAFTVLAGSLPEDYTGEDDDGDA